MSFVNSQGNTISSSFGPVTINPPAVIAINGNVTQPSPGINDGSITIAPTGGTGSLNITWADSPSFNGVTNRTGLAPGSYQVNVTDQSGCIRSQTFILTSPTPAIDIIKIGEYFDANGDGLQNAGDEIRYTFSVSNIGNAQLSNVFVVDLNPSVTVSGNPISLAVGETNSTTFTGTYIIKQSDIENGSFTNTARASGQAGSVTVTADDSHTQNFTKVPDLSILKVQIGGPDPVTAEGQILQYQITVENRGNINLTNVVLQDLFPGASTPVVLSVISGDNSDPGVLNVGETWVYNASYTTTQADIDAGVDLINLASVITTQVPGPTNSRAITEVSQNALISLVKSADPKVYSAAGEEITYSFEVTNTGNVTLTNVSVSDLLPGLGTISPASVTLNPGASQTFTATYTITLADMNTGKVDNTATASGTPPTGPAVTDSDSETITADQNPSISITKTAGQSTYSSAGEEITYSFEVTNTGNVTLTNVSVSDPLPGLGTISPASVTLNPGESQTFTATYTITLADMNAGKVDNTATASGTPPTGPAVTDSDSETITAEQNPSISITKTAGQSTYSSAGEEITYSFEVTNTGNVTLTNVSVSDPLPGLGTISPAPVTLNPGESQTFTATYTITLADMNAGKVDNTATASGTPPTGSAVTDSDSETITAEQNPSISITKTAGQSTYSSAGEEITYSFEVTNTGNVTLTNVSVSDPLPGLGTISPAPVTLNPGESQTFTATYTITLADMNAGKVDNTATASGTPPTGPAVTDSDSETITAEQNPSISITKTAGQSTYSS
ncbi:DUF7507 domain-containing protein, partial [Cecembia rubra]|uniref:DUF7507 domain-containing protein n=1 Tax=Cecembia rubra TaxID=1485585 RepID=UPI001474594C